MYACMYVCLSVLLCVVCIVKFSIPFLGAELDLQVDQIQCKCKYGFKKCLASLSVCEFRKKEMKTKIDNTCHNQNCLQYQLQPQFFERPSKNISNFLVLFQETKQCNNQREEHFMQ